MTDRPRYLIEVQPIADQADPDGIRALRSALKQLGRRFGLRCVDVQRIDPTVQQNQAESEGKPRAN